MKDLEGLIDLQRVLDLRSNQERTSLQASLDSHANAILARLETLRSNEKSVPSSGNMVFHPAVDEHFAEPYNREPHMDNLQAWQLQNNNLGLR